MTRSALLVLSILVSSSVAACAAPSAASGDDSAVADDEAELRSVASGFFERSPLSDRAVEGLRRELARAGDGWVWVRNQGGSFAVQWESDRRAALSNSETTSLAQAAFAFHLRMADASMKNRRYLHRVETVAHDDASLGAALDAIGLSEDSPDAATASERAKLLSALRDAAARPGVTILRDSLDYQVDMYWEGALVVVDETHRQILFATGGYGT